MARVQLRDVRKSYGTNAVIHGIDVDVADGEFIVMVLVAVIGLTMGSGQANPKGALALIFGVLAVFFVILFILGWNQYLWPLLITGREEMYTVVIGIKRMIAGGDATTEWNIIMATAMLALMPPALVVILMQKWFVKGLVETEK